MARKKLQQQPIDQPIIEILESLLANMVGKTDRTIEMDRPVYRNDLPDSLGLQRDMLGAIHDCATNAVPPTRENVLMGLTVKYNRKGEETSKAIDAILAKRTESGDVHSLATWIGEDLRKQRAAAAMEQGYNILAGYEGTVEERLERAASLVTSEISGNSADSSLILDQAELLDHSKDVLRVRYERLVKGLPPGPSLKFKGFVGEYDKDGLPKVVGLVPRLRWGDTTLITGSSKSGKTALGGVWPSIMPGSKVWTYSTSTLKPRQKRLLTVP